MSEKTIVVHMHLCSVKTRLYLSSLLQGACTSQRQTERQRGEAKNHPARGMTTTQSHLHSPLSILGTYACTCTQRDFSSFQGQDLKCRVNHVGSSHLNLHASYWPRLCSFNMEIKLFKGTDSNQIKIFTIVYKILKISVSKKLIKTYWSHIHRDQIK